MLFVKFHFVYDESLLFLHFCGGDFEREGNLYLTCIWEDEGVLNHAFCQLSFYFSQLFAECSFPVGSISRLYTVRSERIFNLSARNSFVNSFPLTLLFHNFFGIPATKFRMFTENSKRRSRTFDARNSVFSVSVCSFECQISR